MVVNSSSTEALNQKLVNPPRQLYPVKGTCCLSFKWPLWFYCLGRGEPCFGTAIPWEEVSLTVPQVKPPRSILNKAEQGIFAIPNLPSSHSTLVPSKVLDYVHKIHYKSRGGNVLRGHFYQQSWIRDSPHWGKSPFVSLQHQQKGLSRFSLGNNVSSV